MFNRMNIVRRHNKIFTQYHASTLEIMSKMRDNFFNPGVLMQICDKTYAGKVASLYFCLDYQIEQNNLLRENIKKTDYLNTKTSYEKREKLTPKKVWCGLETPVRAGMINKHSVQALVSNESGTIIKKNQGTDTPFLKPFLQISFCLCHLGKITNEPRTSALIGW